MKTKALVSILAAMALTTPFAANADELTYNTFQNPLSLEASIPTEFFERLEEVTNGELTTRVFVGGQLLGPTATLSGIRDGAVDGGFIVPTLIASDIPLVAMMPELLPFADNFWAASGASNETMMLNCEECREDLAEFNAVWLGGHGTSPWYLMCRDDINSLDDISGKKIRATGGFANRMMRSFGATGVGMGSTEIPTALQSGQIDCTVGNLSWLRTLGLADIVTSIVDFPIGSYHGLGLFIFNQDSVERLAPENREAMMNLIPEYIAKITKAYADDQESGMALVAERGISLWEPDEAFLSAFEDFKSGELDAVAADIIQLGGPENARELVQQHVDTLDKWSDLVADVNDDPEAFEEILRREVFSKDM